MTLFDRTLLVAGTIFVLGAVLLAANGTRAEEAEPTWVPADVAPLDDGALPPNVPYDTSKLPTGVTIDPETLRLVGLDLEAAEGGVVVDWDLLGSYEYEEDLAGLPTELRVLDGKRVTMAGFLLPLYEFSDIKEFHLVGSHWSCCFGVPPGLSGWVAIQLRPAEAGLPNTVDPIVVTGTFHVREQKEAGYVVAIYAMDDATATVLR